uniref:rRNA biogenesis protein RRP36 n=1 Tax=Syphacia muris TaxID=451379 RepID=A0A0N5AAR8_9BILA
MSYTVCYSSNLESSNAEQKEDVVDNDEKSLAEFRQELATLPMKEVQKLKENLGLSLFNKTFFNSETVAKKRKTLSRTFPKRENPKRPREVSSKKPVSKFRNICEGPKKVRYDPRFDSRCGDFNQHIYETNFGFLDELRENEKKILKTELEEVKEIDPLKAEKIKETLKRMRDRERTKEELQRRKMVISELRHENNERLRQGMKPIFKTRVLFYIAAEVRKKILERKFNDLKRSNKLSKYLKKHPTEFGIDTAEADTVAEHDNVNTKDD